MKVENLEDIYELSPMQQGLLFHTLYAPESGMYFEQYSWTVQGDFNTLAFKQAWQQVIDRHPILRTAFFWEDLEKPYQVVYRQAELIWEEQDWRQMSRDLQAEWLEMFLQADRDRDFDLSQAPLMRLALIQLANDAYQVVWSHHHILLDGWSGPLVFKEVYAFYQAFCQGQELHLQRPRPFREYITWLQQQDLSKAEAFWRKTLQGFTAPTPLGLDRMHNQASLEKNENEQQIKLSQSVSAALESLARQHRLTINTLVQGAWAILLSRYSGEQDVVFGAISSGRPTDLVGVESIVGMFVNTLPMRVDVNPEAELLPWLNRFQAQQAEMRQYEYSPLVKIQGWSEIPANISFFESIVTLENYPVEPEQWEENQNLKIYNLQVFEKTNYPLTIMAGTGTQLLLKILYDDRRFDAATITRMLGHFQILLESIAANPNQRLADLPILTASERYQLLVEFNQTQYCLANPTPQPPSLAGKGEHDSPLLAGEWQRERLTQEYSYSAQSPIRQCIHQLFEKQVERTPDAVAVVFENQQLTYAELNNRANQLAHHLQKLGVKPEVLVGIFVERSLEMVIGILGILKAGGAYVPLDPAYPPERLAFILSDAQVQVLLTQQQLVASLPKTSAKVVCLDCEWELIAQESQDNVKGETTGENLAYVIYTSGSTGKPKGVLINHSNIVRLFAATESRFHFNQQEVWTLFHSYAFDFSVWEIWGALIYGGRLVVVPYWVSRSPEAFYELLCKERVTVLNQTPSAFRQLIQVEQSLTTPRNLALRWVIFGGEALELQSLKPWCERHGDRFPQLVNMYGITETTVHVTFRPITTADLREDAGSVIGIPIPNLQVYVLDAHQNLLPIGVPGEMYVGGAGLARGYLNRPELTAEKFIPNPFLQQSEKSELLYKTGDLARYLPNGELEYLGRIDHQVKVRGFRIELGEIEAVLSQHPAVQQTVVIAREDNSSYKNLVAYVVPMPAEAATTPLQLRSFLKEKLPDYMVPSAFVLLEAIPLTPNGKIDRRLLNTLGKINPYLEKNFVAPRTPIEQAVADIYAQILNLQQVGCSDNFFELGGHSLLAMQVTSRLRETFQVELPLRTLFESPTVAELAEVISSTQKAKQTLNSSSIARVSRNQPLPLSFAQQRLWFLDNLEPGLPDYNIPAPVRLIGQLDVAALEQSFNEIVRRHEIFRTRFVMEGQPIQEIAPSMKVTFPVIDLQAFPEADREGKIKQLIAQEALKPFDLTQAPLFRIKLLQLGEEEHILVLVLHHIIFDLWSIGVLLQEVTELYKAFTTGEISLLPELPIQYADFAVWQRQYLQGEVLEKHLSYWKQQLSGNLLLEFPSDRSRSAVQSNRGAIHCFAFPKDLSDAIQAFSQREGATLFMTLSAAFKTLLYAYTGQQDILIGSPIANRDRVELEPLIGFFVNTLVLRTDLSGNPSFRELLARVREVTLGAYAHQDLPFEKLVEALQPNRKQSEFPLFKVWFALENAPIPDVKLPKLTLSSVEFYSGIARYDLRLGLTETGAGLRGSLEYKTELFDAATIARIVEHLEAIVRQAVAQPEIKLEQLAAIITQAEQQQQIAQEKELAQTSLQKLKRVKRKALHG
ncbi:non-ribosomal peptide synthetase [Coleofasciculus sp. FACHB-1120]|uniref:non-ribosomal peptide synthetase n=1 Tax=Coleofasciculus sp. FACHB-1120 TaxID=2692783 RepID=UPI0016824067|nr:non-ribosomal peptide synthetase [Coleofasciculus sp. FACHB-1120]MBD2741472.1 amino acid adenylation domain-containing protein [Coleofasciculus sp. FACHB-1120]